MNNPYAPPSTREDSPKTPAHKDITLRRIGALAITYILVRILWFSPSALAGSLGAAATMTACIYGFLGGKWKSHVAIALYMVLIISVQSYFLNLALSQPERVRMDLGVNPWLGLILGLIPNIIAFICAIALLIRAPRATASGQ